ncbi:DUF4136 domain-containing protein [Reichenbachiella agariperforans]|uniref:DUF4136 domain-containing protein n=1 Tax=Reichenbachiella agariperforans TaxID=156994 RepID=UPI001C08DDA6|nr:DUF4136 domain-containing protein [Reichenbachiella agariperforans]MBU2913330.1 DUF4136 domain-containing protein [Reichenbachiella agariperforans]
MHRLLIGVLMITLAFGCAPARVIDFVNEEMDFSDYRSYRLINFQSDNKSYSAEGTAFFNQIEQEIRLNMQVKEFAEQKKDADLIVRYEIMSTVTTETQGNTNYYDPYYYYSPPPRTVRYTEGLLLIEFRDAKKKKLVWQASLDLKYSRKETPEMTLKKTIDRIFQTYPYKAGSNEKLSEDTNR